MESTARADRYDLQSAALPAYSWEVPQKPLMVRIPYPVIDKLEGEAVQTFRSLDAKGSEIGGILFGKASAGEPILVSVEDYELITCDYSRGPLYRLSDSDLAKFDRVIAQRASGNSPVVGFFRSHTRKGLALDPEDLVLFETRFNDPRKVALLIRPFATKASMAGFFFWENGAVHGESSYLEFPFRSSQLSSFKPAEVAEPGLTNSGFGGGALPAPSVPRTAARAQIVPIASRRETVSMSGAPPVAEPPVAAPVAPAPEPPPVAAAPAPAPVAAAPAPPVVEPAPAPPAPAPAAPAPEPPVAKAPVAEAPVVEPPAAKPEPPPAKNTNPPWNKAKKVAKSASDPAAKSPAESKAPAETARPAAEVKEVKEAKEARESKETKEKPAAAVLPAPAVKPVETAFDRLAAEEQPARGNKFLWLAIGAIVPVILILVLFVYPGILRRSGKPSDPGFDTSALALRVERTGGELQLTWNRDSDPIRNATKGVLSISDGPQHQDVELDLTQLQKGSIAYTPATGDVVFRMEVTAKGQGKTASEMVRALSTRPSPLAADPVAPAAAAPNIPAAKTPDPAAAAAATPSTEQPEAEEPAKAPQRVLKPFRADSLSARLHPASAGSNDIPDAPSLGRVDSNASVSALNMNAVAAPVAPPPAKSAAPPVPVAPPAPKNSGGGQIQQAVLVSRKEPEYPRLARETGAKGIVELTATIGTDGKVKKVAIVKGHPMLVKAASDAVMQWVYKPTVLNGVPVEAQTQVLINFMGDR